MKVPAPLPFRWASDAGAQGPPGAEPRCPHWRRLDWVLYWLLRYLTSPPSFQHSWSQRLLPGEPNLKHPPLPTSYPQGTPLSFPCLPLFIHRFLCRPLLNPHFPLPALRAPLHLSFRPRPTS